MLKQRFLSLASFMPVDFLTGWFMGAPLDSICRRNVEDFIAYGFYCRTYGELPPKVLAAMNLQHAFACLLMTVLSSTC